MIVQPSPIGARSRPRRLLRALGLMLPVALLVGVVGVGLAGPAPDPDPVPSVDAATPPVVAVVDPSPAPPDEAPADEAPADEAPADEAPAGELPAAALTVFPGRIAGLRVHGVQWTLEARSRGLARGAIAIAGYFGLDSLPPGCSGGRLGIFGPFCERTGVLAERPWKGGPRTETELAPYHLHAQIPVGVRVPHQASLAVGPLDDTTPAVVVIARFDDPRATPCIPEGRHCGQELVIERIAWVEGRDYPNTVTIDPRLDTGALTGADLRRRARTASAALTPDGYRLLSVYVLPDTLARMHPEAADGLVADLGVWYVRGLHRAGSPDRIDWLVADPETDRVLRYGSIATSRFADVDATQ